MQVEYTAPAAPDKARRVGDDTRRVGTAATAAYRGDGPTRTDTEDLNACMRFLARFVFAPNRPPITYSIGPYSPRVVARPSRRRFAHAQLTWACEEWAYPHPSRRIIDVETMRTACAYAGLRSCTVDYFPGVHIGEPARRAS